MKREEAVARVKELTYKSNVGWTREKIRELEKEIYRLRKEYNIKHHEYLKEEDIRFWKELIKKYKS